MPEKKKDKSSFIEEARRKQIIDSAIQMIAEQGFNRTSLDDIADNVHVSKGVITYHFENKNELIRSVLDHIIQQQRIHRESWINQQSTPWGKLQAFIRADIAFYQKFPQLVVALIELWGSMSSREEKKTFETTAYLPARRLMESILRQGLKTGEFTDLNPTLVSSVIMGMIDGLMVQWVFGPGQVNLEQCGEEIIQFCERRVFGQLRIAAVAEKTAEKK